MPNYLARSLFSALLLSTLATTPVHAADAPAGDATAQPGSAKDPVVATINGSPLYKSDVMAEAANLSPQVLQSVPMDKLFPQLVKQAIAERVVAQAGYAEHLEDTPAVKAELKTEMKSAERRNVIEAYLRKTVEPKLTDDVLRKKYDELKANFKPQDELRASHILVKTEAEAKDIIKQINGGADFATLAKQDSIDKASAEHGGDLGYFTKPEMVKSFSDAAFSMKPGQVSQTPVKSDFGWHVIKVVDRRETAPPAFDTVKNQLKAQVAQQMAMEEVRNLVSQAKVDDASGKPMQMGSAEPDGAAPAAPAVK